MIDVAAYTLGNPPSASTDFTKAATAKGVRIGSSSAAVIKAYGPCTVDYPRVISWGYNINGERLAFELSKDAVRSISLADFSISKPKD